MREIEILSFGTITELAERLPIRSRYFQLLLAWDAPDTTPQQLMRFFKPLVERGLVYFCAWGSNCEDVHDAVDKCDIERMPETPDADYIVMTTWHDDESLEEALCSSRSVHSPLKALTRPNVIDSPSRLETQIGPTR
jgi:hypothetical protein